MSTTPLQRARQTMSYGHFRDGDTIRQRCPGCQLDVKIDLDPTELFKSGEVKRAGFIRLEKALAACIRKDES